jgi:starch synthase
VVRRTGGLADSVVDVDESPAGTGFVFDGDTPDALVAALARARARFAEKAGWRAVQARAMDKDFSWRAAAVRYREVYESIKKNQS